MLLCIFLSIIFGDRVFKEIFCNNLNFRIFLVITSNFLSEIDKNLAQKRHAWTVSKIDFLYYEMLHAP